MSYMASNLQSQDSNLVSLIPFPPALPASPTRKQNKNLGHIYSLIQRLIQ